MRLRLSALLVLSGWVLLAACGSSEPAPPSTHLVFLPAADSTAPEHFFDTPFPSDARLTADAKVDWTGFPNPRKNSAVSGFLPLAANHKGAALLPVVHFQFSAEPEPASADTVWPAAVGTRFQIVNVDPNSPARGERVPVVAATGDEDIFRVASTLSIAPAPGNLLLPGTRYAALVTREAKDAAGAALGRDAAFAAALDAGQGTWGSALAPLRAQWLSEGRELSELVAATVFTTGRPVEDTAALSESALARFSVQVQGLRLETAPARRSDALCEFVGSVTYPQFQKGAAPYDSDGDIVVDADGAPVRQRDEVAPVRVVIPRSPMPPSGYPLVLTVHGTGGRSDSLVAPDLIDENGQVFGRGTAFPLAALGFASAGSAMPVNKERVPNGPADDYVNPANLAAIGHTLRQGVVESRLFLSALLSLRMPATLLAECTGASLPNGITDAKFDPAHVYMTGQSLGGMYSTMVAAVDPRIQAVVPTGGGGYFSFQFLHTEVVKNPQAVVQTLLGTNAKLSHLHPALGLAHAGLEPGDPIAFARRVGFDPLPGKKPVHIFQPGAPGDRYFPIQVYNALAVSYTHPYAGSLVWPELGIALAQRGLGGVALPLTENVVGKAGAYTGAIEPLAPVPGKDAHQIIFASAALQHQLACFFYTHLRTGKATIVKLDDNQAQCGL